MRIHIRKDASCGKIEILAGEYWVHLNAENQEIVLVGYGRNLSIPATRRRTKTKSRVSTIQFYSGGGPIWSLVVTVPMAGEWVSFIEYKKIDKQP